MATGSASALSHPNIAFIKYWGNQNDPLRLPSNGSISLTLDGLTSETSVEFDPALGEDECWIDGKRPGAQASKRIQSHLELIRQLAGITAFARVRSENNFPAGTGIASSASGFAALTLAASHAAGLSLADEELSRLARRGSGSAARSIYGGYAELLSCREDRDAIAVQIAGHDHWELIDVIAVVSTAHKQAGSTQGHQIAGTSPLQAARVGDAPRRLQICRQAILDKDFFTLADIAEQDSNMMHAVMLTSTPRLLYWLPATIEIMHAVETWRKEGLRVFYTIDAGPNVHCVCMPEDSLEVENRLRRLSSVQLVFRAGPGTGTVLK